MQRVEWTNDLEIGIPVIDAQHQRIVEYINTLASMQDDIDSDTVAKLIDSLVDYTFSHFAFEESLMEEAGYEYLSIHQGTHEAFTRRITVLHSQFKAGQDVSKDLGKLLLTWLIDHIQSDDQSYAPLVREKFSLIEKKSDGNWLGNTLKKFFS